MTVGKNLLKLTTLRSLIFVNLHKVSKTFVYLFESVHTLKFHKIFCESLCIMCNFIFPFLYFWNKTRFQTSQFSVHCWHHVVDCTIWKNGGISSSFIIMFWGVRYLIISDPTQDNKIGWLMPNIYWLCYKFENIRLDCISPNIFATHSSTNKFGLNLSNFISKFGPVFNNEKYTLLIKYR